ncbi:MAG: hypothetical protein ACKVT0_23040, partial [Planctomycetaceae bacterium]
QRDFVSGKLTPEEASRRVELAANAINRKSTDLDVLEKQASELFGHEEFIRDEMNRVRNLGRYISEESILALLRTYFGSHHPRVTLQRDSEKVYSFRLTEELRHAIHDATRGGPTWINRSRDGFLSFTTSGEIAFRCKELDLVNSSHPLVRAAIKTLKPQLDTPLARIGQAELSLKSCDENTIPPGIYYFLLYSHTIHSIRSRRVLETVAWSINTQAFLDSELGERLLYLTIEYGIEWGNNQYAPAMSAGVWNALRIEAMKRNRDIYDAEKRENGAMYYRRRNALQAEHDHDIAVKGQRLKTAQQRGSTRILPAMEGQIEKAKSEFRKKFEELDQGSEARVSLSEPLAACAVHVMP